MVSSPTDPPLPAGVRMVSPLTDGSGAQLSANKLIEKNAKLASANFGSSADNATAVVAYLWR